MRTVDIAVQLDYAYDMRRDEIRRKLDSDRPWDDYTRFLVRRMWETRNALRSFEQANDMIPRDMYVGRRKIRPVRSVSLVKRYPTGHDTYVYG